MRVFVKSMRGDCLSMTSPSHARKLLKEGKATIYGYKPFTIRLNYASGETVQDTQLCIDSGAKFMGFAIESEGHILGKGTIELRTDVKDNLTTRKTLRQNRRSRKTRYRRCKFKFHTKRVFSPKQNKWINKNILFESPRSIGWLPPSIQSRVDNQIFWIERFKSLLPNLKVIVEVGKFDVQKILNPEIEGAQYQQGDAFGFWNTRYYVFARDNYTCLICKKKGGILHTHHIIPRKSGGSDKADNLGTVHDLCHEQFHQGKINFVFKKPKLYRETAFMNAFRIQIFKRLQCSITYGSVTQANRQILNLEKTHYNDAIAISGITKVNSNTKGILTIKQFRKKKRSLHEQIARKGRKEPNTLSKRNEKNTPSMNGVFLNDKVLLFGRIGYVSGFCSGGLYVKDIEGEYITKPNKTYKQVSFKDIVVKNHNNNWQFAYKNM